MISPKLIPNHPVDFVTKDDLPGTQGNRYEMEDNKSPPSAAPRGRASRRPLGFVVFNLVRISLVLPHLLDLN